MGGYKSLTAFVSRTEEENMQKPIIMNKRIFFIMFMGFCLWII
jgi:hypothetical protein